MTERTLTIDDQNQEAEQGAFANLLDLDLEPYQDGEEREYIPPHRTDDLQHDQVADATQIESFFVDLGYTPGTPEDAVGALEESAPGGNFADLARMHDLTIVHHRANLRRRNKR